MGWATAVSPDGKWLAYRMQVIPGYESDRFRIALYEFATGKITVISEAFDNWVDDIKWAPDSKHIYFIGEVASYMPLFRINIETRKIEEILPKELSADLIFQVTVKKFITTTD